MEFGQNQSVQTIADAAEVDARLRRLTHVLYALYGIALLTGGMTALAAVIINYIKRDDVRGTLYESHFRWQIRTFWWSVFWGVVGGVLALLLIGFVVLWVLGVWILYRIIKGWLYLNDGKLIGVNPD